MVVIDHKKNIQRIVDKIKADTNLYDNGVTEGKLRDVFFGDPENNSKFTTAQVPYAYVTTRKNLQKSRRDFGITAAENSRQITVEYEIVLVAKSYAKTTQAQKQMYDIIKNLYTLAETDPTFKDPVAANDPIFSRCIISEAPYDEPTRGKLIVSTSLILLATIGTSFSIDFPTIGEVAFLSKPSQLEGIIFGDDHDQTGTRAVTPNGNFGRLDVEYESTFALDAAFRAKFGTEESVTFKRGSDSRVMTVLYVEINPTATFDSIERSILHLEIIS